MAVWIKDKAKVTSWHVCIDGLIFVLEQSLINNGQMAAIQLNGTVMALVAPETGTRGLRGKRRPFNERLVLTTLLKIIEVS